MEYYFSPEATKAAFEANSESFLPQKGSFCTLGISVRKKLDDDTRYADIVDGKLYLFVNAAVLPCATLMNGAMTVETGTGLMATRIGNLQKTG